MTASEGSASGVERDFRGPISNKILSEAFSAWPTIRSEHFSQVGKRCGVREDRLHIGLDGLLHPRGDFWIAVIHVH